MLPQILRRNLSGEGRLQNFEAGCRYLDRYCLERFKHLSRHHSLDLKKLFLENQSHALCWFPPQNKNSDSLFHVPIACERWSVLRRRDFIAMNYGRSLNSNLKTLCSLTRVPFYPGVHILSVRNYCKYI